MTTKKVSYFNCYHHHIVYFRYTIESLCVCLIIAGRELSLTAVNSCFFTDLILLSGIGIICDYF